MTSCETGLPVSPTYSTHNLISHCHPFISRPFFPDQDTPDNGSSPIFFRIKNTHLGNTNFAYCHAFQAVSFGILGPRAFARWMLTNPLALVPRNKNRLQRCRRKVWYFIWLYPRIWNIISGSWNPDSPFTPVLI